MHKFILGNWKMNKGNNEILEFCSVFNTLLKDYKKQHFLQNIIIAIAPTFTGLIPFYSKIDSSIITMAQNVSDELSGARTGQISSKMLSDMQVKYCLIGHSEVRQYLFETDQVINKKIKLLLNQNIIPVLCIGETLIDFEQNKTVEIVQNQLRECLKDIKLNDETIIIAYEPI
jgi:triosephosphate isomerase